MNKSRPDGELEKAVTRRRARADEWRRTGERPLARNLALVGTLGWLIIVPALLGTFAGRALDRLLGTGITFTAALICTGLVAGCWLAWNRTRSA